MYSTEFQLTRYLYSKIEVSQSLLLALLDRNIDEALFWAYELYYSGFEEYVFDYVYQLYDFLYESNHPKLRDFIYQDNLCATLKECHFGSIVYTLALRSFDLSPFLLTYFCRTCTPLPISPLPNSFRVTLHPQDIEIYQTVSISPARKTLPQVCRFPIRQQVNAIFQTDAPKDRASLFQTESLWLRYAIHCPIWESRIREHGGIVNQEGEPFFETDEDKESFYEAWGYEPEEQSKELQGYIGIFKTESWTLEQFAERYGYSLQPLEKIKIKNKNKKTMKPKLTNLENTLLIHDEPIKSFCPQSNE